MLPLGFVRSFPIKNGTGTVVWCGLDRQFSIIYIAISYNWETLAHFKTSMPSICFLKGNTTLPTLPAILYFKNQICQYKCRLKTKKNAIRCESRRAPGVYPKSIEPK